ncbi:ADP-glyceromanno-heptose 6-epimerase [Rhizosaccharibacter radicis]|uniref:ADP-L-glycero-D-manno-heptose-6-epimerase n=1 Tax=Rhizosaccharibacter radicis TaxID=2782605 RepID=A0ABT1W1J7_9PROT|nr:ADP-glyceromanno-heptose 6-epimerase [Acetobacteraceae bacterium KSS12]
MILLTGGAGFIGSCFHAALRRRGESTAIVDRLGGEGKWRNLLAHPPSLLLPPEELGGFLEGGHRVDAVVHLGAISETTARDGDLVWRSNVALSQLLWRWCAREGVPFLYASSAATYGAADRPDLFSDDPSRLPSLRPLNLYGWSKHAFDLWVQEELARGHEAPPRWNGLKFFNVYGPNEYHKGGMVSVVKVKHDEVRAGRPARLFRSDRPDIADGQQKRDFIWVGDVVDVMLWLLDTPGAPSGLFNLGTGAARSYLDLAHAVCDAAGVERRVEFTDMPAALRGQYQSFTCADMDRLRAAGYRGQFTTLEAGVRRYVEQHLAPGAEPFC